MSIPLRPLIGPSPAFDTYDNSRAQEDIYRALTANPHEVLDRICEWDEFLLRVATAKHPLFMPLFNEFLESQEFENFLRDA